MGKRARKKYQKDHQKACPEQYRRIGTIAFRCAMILHALWGFPQDNETRQKVIALVKYIANYTMERYVYKFGAYHDKHESSTHTAFFRFNGRGVYKPIPDDLIAEWVERNSVLGADGKPVEGYGTFANEWNKHHPECSIDKSTVKRRMEDYRRRHP